MDTVSSRRFRRVMYMLVSFAMATCFIPVFPPCSHQILCNIRMFRTPIHVRQKFVESRQRIRIMSKQADLPYVQPPCQRVGSPSGSSA